MALNMKTSIKEAKSFSAASPMVNRKKLRTEKSLSLRHHNVTTVPLTVEFENSNKNLENKLISASYFNASSVL